MNIHEQHFPIPFLQKPYEKHIPRLRECHMNSTFADLMRTYIYDMSTQAMLTNPWGAHARVEAGLTGPVQKN